MKLADELRELQSKYSEDSLKDNENLVKLENMCRKAAKEGKNSINISSFGFDDTQFFDFLAENRQQIISYTGLSIHIENTKVLSPNFLYPIVAYNITIKW